MSSLPFQLRGLDQKMSQIAKSLLLNWCGLSAPLKTQGKHTCFAQTRMNWYLGRVPTTTRFSARIIATYDIRKVYMCKWHRGKRGIQYLIWSSTRKSSYRAVRLTDCAATTTLLWTCMAVQKMQIDRVVSAGGQRMTLECPVNFSCENREMCRKC